MSTKVILTTVVLSMLALSLWHCETGVPRATGGGDGDADGDGDSDVDTNFFDTENMPPGCGDSILTPDEACDDGNHVNGDGCRGDCLVVESGYSCNPPGEPCHLMAKCGDGAVIFPEFCDDNNTAPGDGCSELCKVEVGFKCEGSPSVCTPTTCGDTIIEGAEGCDDGNSMPFDGCSADCQVEPACVSGGNCQSSCGDGLLIGEDCDDGNNIDGDGCSAACTVEEGYRCIQPDTQGFMDVPVIYKDFTTSDSDFEPGATGCSSVSAGMVADTLDANGKPVQASTSVKGCGTVNNLASWYDYSGNQDAIIITTLRLFDNGSGGFVNRWGVNGEPWVAFTNEQWCNDSSCSSCSCSDMCIYTCTWGSAACCVSPLYFDGQPFFFPLDGLGITPTSQYATADIGPTYGYEAWPDEIEAVAIANLTPPAGYSFSHNFHFTSEVRFWFKYDASVNPVLNFVGDDDVWVFINNKLALDLGGIHTPMEGEVVVNDLGLNDGEVYEIVVFQAERQTTGSTYRLTLSGFSTARSVCTPDCGDGVVGIGEECDDGINDGGYGECAEGCVLGEYCGDGIVQQGFESCDDGNFEDGDGCPSSCRNIIV